MKNIQIILIFSLLWFGCEKPIEPIITSPQNTSISIEVVETGVVDATLQITIEDSTAEYWTYSLIRNDSVISTETVVDTFQVLITDNNLLPTTEYNYQAFWMDESVKIDSSNIVSVFTGDTTSHEFVWEIDTLGSYGSYLLDVHIVNENDIWAVGKLSIPDSAGYIPTHANYNAAHWDGSEWKYIKINSTATLYCIQYFNEDDIWVSSGYPKHWDGNEWTHFDLSEYGLDTAPGNACWGTSSSNMYFAGLNGSIVYFDGLNFSQLAYQTNIELRDISGTADLEHIFVTGYNLTGESIALEYANNSWNTLYEGINLFSEPYGRMKSVDVIDGYALFGCTEGLWRYNYYTGFSELETSEDMSWENSIRQVFANASNDIIIISNWGMVNHFNGNTWKTDEKLLSLVLNNGSFLTRGAAFKENMIVISNWIGQIVLRGYRN